MCASLYLSHLSTFCVRSSISPLWCFCWYQSVHVWCFSIFLYQYTCNVAVYPCTYPLVMYLFYLSAYPPLNVYMFRSHNMCVYVNLFFQSFLILVHACSLHRFSPSFLSLILSFFSPSSPSQNLVLLIPYHLSVPSSLPPPPLSPSLSFLRPLRIFPLNCVYMFVLEISALLSYSTRVVAELVFAPNLAPEFNISECKWSRVIQE